MNKLLTSTAVLCVHWFSARCTHLNACKPYGVKDSLQWHVGYAQAEGSLSTGSPLKPQQCSDPLLHPGTLGTAALVQDILGSPSSSTGCLRLMPAWLTLHKPVGSVDAAHIQHAYTLAGQMQPALNKHGPVSAQMPWLAATVQKRYITFTAVMTAGISFHSAHRMGLCQAASSHCPCNAWCKKWWRSCTLHAYACRSGSGGPALLLLPAVIVRAGRGLVAMASVGPWIVHNRLKLGAVHVPPEHLSLALRGVVHGCLHGSWQSRAWNSVQPVEGPAGIVATNVGQHGNINAWHHGTSTLSESP